MEPTTKTPIANDASNGLVTSRDSSTLQPGELSQAIGCEYRIGSPELHKLPGRTDTGETLDGEVLALAKLQYDGADDVLVADANGEIWESVASATPSFTSIVTGLSATAVPQYTGVRNEWIRCNGVDDNMVREPDAVPGGTQGNWRTIGMQTAGAPYVNSIGYNTNGGQVLRPATYTNQAYIRAYGAVPQTSYNGYRSPNLAIDGYGGVGTGTVSGTSGLNTLTGVDTLFTTQLSVGSILTFPDGTTATVQTIVSSNYLTTDANLDSTLVASSFIYSGSTVSDDSETTYSVAYTGDCLQQVSPLVTRTCICTWNFTSDLVATGRVLSVVHSASQVPGDWGAVFGERGMKISLEYSVTPGVASFPEAAADWLPLGVAPRYQPFPAPLEDSVALPDGLDLTNLKVRAYVTSFLGKKSGKWLDVYHGVYDIKVSTGATTTYTAVNPIQYGVSESYTDSDGVEHQSNMGDVTTVQPSQLQDATSVTLTLPQITNPLADKFLIWRSVDTPGGGFPVMYLMGEVDITTTSWTDLFTVPPADTAANGEKDQYQILEVLYSTGEASTASYYTAPPKSFMSLVFQGCVCYFPSDSDAARRVYYSLPATVSNTGIEQVPEQYYLDFQTPRNDQVKSGAITNGGRSMLVFFENYTMLVNYLPQGSDPGGFNNVVKEYVSNVRGCAGPFACCEFTLPSGQTLVASIDGLGMWLTNGVNLVEEWTLDLDWDAAMADVDLSTIELFDKPHKRRIEMLFTAADGTSQEYHFFYGRMKQSPEGKRLPLITGPHPSKTRCRLHTIIDGKWASYSGGSTSAGKVFTDDTADADESEGYDATGIVPWQWTLGDLYVGGIHKAQIVESANIKFADSPTKDFQMIGTFTRDSGTADTIEKTIVGDHQRFPKQIYWHQYCDRHKIGFSDLTNTASPSFISYVLKTRSAGGARDK